MVRNSVANRRGHLEKWSLICSRCWRVEGLREHKGLVRILKLLLHLMMLLPVGNYIISITKNLL